MKEIVDNIVYAYETFFLEIQDFAIRIASLLIIVIMAMTSPIWIIPVLIIRRIKELKGEILDE